MNQNSDKSEGVLVLSMLALVFLLVGIYMIREELSALQKFIIMFDFKLLHALPFLQYFYPSDIMGWEEIVHGPSFQHTSYDIINNSYFNIYQGQSYSSLGELYKTFYILNTILLSITIVPFSIYISKLYNKKIEKFKINKTKEEVYPNLIKNKRRNHKNQIFEVMDYFPPVIYNSEDEFINGSIRLSKKNIDTNWTEAQKNKLLQMKKELTKYNYLKLIYLDKYYIRNINDKELLDYIKILRYKGKKPERNTKKVAKVLPKKLTKENYKQVMHILNQNLIEHDINIEYGRLIMPNYYIFTPLDNKRLDEFTTPGSKELIAVLKKYVVDDFKKEINKTIKDLKKEINKLEKQNDSEAMETIKQNKNLVEEMENMLNPEFTDSRNQKILNLATIHQFEETFLVAMLIYGRSLVNLPIGVMSRMKYSNSVLWYALTSIGRTYKYRSGLPLSILFQIEKEEAESKEKAKIDIDTINPEEIISDEVKNELNGEIGDQYSGGKAFNTKNTSTRPKIKKNNRRQG